jgi:hypothetical protein
MNEVKKILDEIEASLEPHRNAKAVAQELLAQALALKEQSAANVATGEKDADRARLLLDDHDQAMKSKKAARAQARADRIASGGKAEPLTPIADDVEGRQLRADAEEADAAYINLKEIDALRGVELQKADARVAAAETAITQAYVEGIATRMIEQDSILRGLHAELSEMVPSEIHRPRNMARPSPLVEKALALVPVDWINTPINQLRGAAVVPAVFTKPASAVHFLPSEPQDGDMMRVVGGLKPRGLGQR